METEFIAERPLRWTVFRRMCPMTDLVGTLFWNAFWECFRCHLRLRRAGIRHHDISISTLMYDTDAGRGILNDFDLAVQDRDPSLSETERRTGVMPFMALDLLRAPDEEVKRGYCHDVESFGWVLLWICCTYENGRELPKRPLQAFIQHDFESTYVHKVSIILGRGLKPTASYGWDHFGVALNLVMEYRLRHNIRRDAIWVNSRRSNKDACDSDQSVDDEPKAIDAELQTCRERLASARLPVDLF